MAAIHGKDTGPEMIVRRWLWRRGYRYRVNYNRLPGHPDIVMRKYKACIFINGCFWHGHNIKPETVTNDKSDGTRDITEDSECCRVPKTNRGFWVRKILRNMERDVEVQHKLTQMGWRSITIWECELKGVQQQKTLQSLEYTLNSIWLRDIRSYQSFEEETTDFAAEDTPT